ncbi:MAG: SDR family oxidoreductase [Candidatus Eremiobacteraeota bacterium]|nr:SDR family oxidoreductase [Candidatus Eremiobacteraeota bacterium]
MRILVTGATGYIGGRLVPRLYAQGHSVRCLARAALRLRDRFPADVEIVEGSIEDPAALQRALTGCDVAYYLVHSMRSTTQFAAADRDAARAFGAAAKEAGLRLIVYLGGLGEPHEELSTHLQSRHEVGKVLRASGVPVIEFQAAQIIGSGSISFEMMRYLTERLPVMIAPRWVYTQCQPIGVRDVLSYLIGALRQPFENRTYQIGGATVETYRSMMLRYAGMRGLRRYIVTVPVFTPKLSSYWVHLITPVPAQLARPLIAGLSNKVIVRDNDATRDFPWIQPQSFDEALRLALDRSQSADRESTWFDAFAGENRRGEFVGLQEGMFIDRRELVVNAPTDQTAAIFSSLGGEHGWLASNSLWRLRGWIDRAVGGTGLRRGRRSMKNLRVGDALDFWRVEEYHPGRMLRLRAEMLLPGRAWLQFESEPLAPSQSRLVQTAFFEPRGVGGYVYWYGVLPFHGIVFGRMIKGVARAAELASIDSPREAVP